MMKLNVQVAKGCHFHVVKTEWWYVESFWDNTGTLQTTDVMLMPYSQPSINIETVSGPCNTCFWYARAPAVRNTSRGGETVSIFIANLRAIFNDILRKISTIFYAKTLFIADVVWTQCGIDSEPVCHVRAFLNLVRSMRSTTFNAFTFWVIFCHITLERSWVISFFLYFCWMYVATAVTQSEQSPS